MQYEEFIDSLDQEQCPGGLEPCLQALWHDAKGEWNIAHEIVQQVESVMAARIHAYLHREDGEDWNARYWYRRAESAFPKEMGLKEEWNSLLREITG